LAMAQGQRVYTLSQDNGDNLSQIIIDSEARSEIQNGIARGYLHQSGESSLVAC